MGTANQRVRDFAIPRQNIITNQKLLTLSTDCSAHRQRATGYIGVTLGGGEEKATVLAAFEGLEGGLPFSRTFDVSIFNPCADISFLNTPMAFPIGARGPIPLHSRSAPAAGIAYIRWITGGGRREQRCSQGVRQEQASLVLKGEGWGGRGAWYSFPPLPGVGEKSEGGGEGVDHPPPPIQS